MQQTVMTAGMREGIVVAEVVGEVVAKVVAEVTLFSKSQLYGLSVYRKLSEKNSK